MDAVSVSDDKWMVKLDSTALDCLFDHFALQILFSF